MRVRYGDIWERFPTEFVVVPANIGWRKTGANVMGRGMAKQAAERFPELPEWWGYYCRTMGADTPVMLHPQHRVIMFPTKPLDEEQPHLSWRQDSDLKLIWRSAAQLAAVVTMEGISLPMVGCGNGRLTPELVLPILRTFLSHDRFQLVTDYQHKPVVDGIIFGQYGNWLLNEDPRPGPTGQPLQSHFAREFA